MEKEVMVLQSKSWMTTEGNNITSPFPPEKTINLGKMLRPQLILLYKVRRLNVVLVLSKSSIR